MDATERELLLTTVRDALAVAGKDADAVLADLGWLEMLLAEPDDALDIVFRSLGTTNAAASVLDDVVVAGLGIGPRADVSVLLPSFGSWQPPGTRSEGRVSAAGIATGRVTTATDILIVCGDGALRSVVTIPVGAAEVRVVGGVDPGADLHVVRVVCDSAGEELIDAGAWEAAVARGRRALASEIAGASRAMLELARTHAIDRVQFDRPIARFQAVRHRLADALVAVESLDAALIAARDVESAMTAALAKAVAGRTARTVAAHCQQVLAGVGFTTDHPFHRFLKRTMALEGILGSADEITLDLGRSLLAQRRVPTLIEL